LFSFLKRKPEFPASVPAPARARVAEPARVDTEAERVRQREIARATAAKIDAIELEMASDIFDDAPWGAPLRTPAAASPAPEASQPAVTLCSSAQPAVTPVAQEAALLYAEGQGQAAERTLRASLIGAGRSERLTWWMLFDLYQLGGREQEFENIGIDYAIEFETMPPAWNPRVASSAQRAYSGVTPTEAFSGVLAHHVDAQLQRLLDAASPVVRLEFGAVRDATADGCESLLTGLKALQAADTELVVAGTDNLVAVLRPMLTIGEREASRAPWLLLLELLQLTDRPKDFHETAMDYRVTFETDPPRFTAPQRVATAATGAGQAGDRFLLPPLVTGDPTELLEAIDGYARATTPAVLDCSRLVRIDRDAAASLCARLRALAGDGHPAELRELNNLALPLLRLLGTDEPVRIFSKKY
ncbi:MAG TPA: hypothetical protein VNT33_00440, partial [Telluria sp.]|nr:hypothetical protein [Telluria sp.]